MSHTPSTMDSYEDKPPSEATLTAGPIYVSLEGSENPARWSQGKKLLTVVPALIFAFLTAFNATSYSSAYDSVNETFGNNISEVVFLLGNFTFIIMIAFFPLFLAPLSETIGRSPLYWVSLFIGAVTFIPQAKANSFMAIPVTRIFQGAAGSVGNSMVGGTISDVYDARSRGPAMSMFTLLIFLGQAAGTASGPYINARLGFRWLFWIQAIINFVVFVAFSACASETAITILTRRKAERLTKETGKEHAGFGSESKSILQMVKQSVSRPLVFLFTEPIVTAMSLWIGCTWGTLFLFIVSVPIVFEGVYGFSQEGAGLILLTMGIGSLVGLGFNMIQQWVYSRTAYRKGRQPDPEVRLYAAAAGGVAFPIGIFGFAWTASAEIPWEVPAFFLVIAYTAVFCIYAGVFSYLADAYEIYASSAQASQSLLRNIFASTFPLIGIVMYQRLSYSIAGTILGVVAVVLGAAPFAVIKWGGMLRATSKVASGLAKTTKE